jgi:hypothetical protein
MNAIEHPGKAQAAALEKRWRELPAVYGLINNIRSKIMNSSAELMSRLSDRLHHGFNTFTKPRRERFVPLNPSMASTVRGQAVPAREEVFKQLGDFRTQSEVSVPVAEDQRKPAKAASEALGVGLVVAVVLGLGTMWAWIVVQLAVMVFQVEPFLVRNILWTHQ